MKSVLFIFAIVCVVGVFSDDDKKDLTREQILECVAESGVEETKVEDIKLGNQGLETTREIDCFAACVFKKQGIMNEAGVITPDKPMDNEAAKQCVATTGADACDTAGKVLKCFISNNLVSLMDLDDD
ncbi:hypothetical protein TSAR_001852 [Trichomalopsis sarcophagae]|uniref:Uncharacterized protein n=1 Tax=Trichomalopsis sarcophagae TaxID=543379 RepID=A0A232F3R3_9HYME|nr:hypothetical protein TSAR_001852 [Trichomalopsis sarcophagae]